MDDYAIEIVQNIRDTDEWKRDNTYCERIGICLGFCQNSLENGVDNRKR